MMHGQSSLHSEELLETSQGIRGRYDVMEKDIGIINKQILFHFDECCSFYFYFSTHILLQLNVRN